MKRLHVPLRGTPTGFSQSGRFQNMRAPHLSRNGDTAYLVKPAEAVMCADGFRSSSLASLRRTPADQPPTPE
jgi:hypothetical protein